MVGFLKSRFIRTLPIPKELLCTVCEEVLNDPYNCMVCTAWFCKACLSNICSNSQSCDHKYVEANKFLKNKIDEMFIKCENSLHGCFKTDKVCEISKHEKTCVFKKFTCHHQECMKKTSKNELDEHSQNCNFSSYLCSDGCGRNMKLFEKATHNCVEWLHSMIENQNIKNNVLKEENEEIRQISEKQKNFYLDRIRELEIKNAELVEEVNLSKRQQEGMTKLFQKEKETLILDYEFKINKMHEKASQKISYCRQKSEEHFKNLSKNLEKSVLNYLETTKDNVTNFNNRVQADSHDLILSKSMEINNGNSRFSSPKNTKKILDQSLNNSSFSNKKTSSGKKNLGNSKFIKI